jgi:putative pyruvate formate lyase activating enzyme
MTPGYLLLHSQGVLEARAKAAVARLRQCRLCPRNCRVDRGQGGLGFCGSGRLARVASYCRHFGEEECLVGQGGSGTIFFAGCNLRCVFCQNADISRESSPDQEVTPGDLAQIMLELQAKGAANINLVSPSHVVPQVLEALPQAADRGLCLPLVYNTGGYDSLETLGLLRQVVDIYMPDAKYWDPDIGFRLSGVPDYPQVAREAIREMHRQVGDLTLDREGLAVRGLLVRHLVLPQGLAGTEPWMAFLARELSPDTYVNLMDQYRPWDEAYAQPGLDRGLDQAEFQMAKIAAKRAGLRRLYHKSNKYFERLLHNIDGQDSDGP